MDTIKQIDEAIERAKKEIDSRLGDEALKTLRDDLIEKISASGEKLKADIEALGKINIAAIDLIRQGAQIFISKPVDGNYPLDLRSGSYIVNRYKQHEFILPPGIWRIVLVAVPVDPKEKLSPEDEVFLPNPHGYSVIR